MRLVPLFALVSFASLICGAQSTADKTGETPSRTSSVVVMQAPSGQGCPVGFQAKRAGSGGLVQVSPGMRRPGQGYQLTFTSWNGGGIAQARITLHGMSGAHVIPAAGRSLPDATESFDLSPATGTKPRLFHSTVYAEKLTGVQWIELNEVTYADGTRWQESDTATCHIAPNGFMLVAGGN